MPTAANVITYNNFINGEWVPSVSGEVFENRSPANTDDLIGLFQKSTKDDVRRAVEAAAAAYTDWRLVPAPRRAEIL
jgi:acyl-CoA reductase-like NAD-dependent aldehyde dehydrogenase